jgi:hypothetical protein
VTRDYSERVRSCAAAAISFLVLAFAARAGADTPARKTGEAAPAVVQVFRDVALHFQPDSSSKFARRGLTYKDSGREARVTVTLPKLRGPHRITALLTVRPVPKSDREVFDRYDRAGNIRMEADGGPDLEVVRFITAYGGRTDHEIDVTALAPLLTGRRTFVAHIDTWSSPAWSLDLSLRYTPIEDFDDATWAVPVYYTPNFNAERMPHGDSARVEIPPGLARVVLRYTTTGHCTDGIDEDEFVSKANVISVDGRVVARFHPWRDDCRQFRDRNPYCSRWTDGTWSSDYSRSGWCPGTEVLPTEFDLTDALPPGRHTIGFAIESMRPKDAKGNYGYWRVSAALVGWDKPPRLWRNP